MNRIVAGIAISLMIGSMAGASPIVDYFDYGTTNAELGGLGGAGGGWAGTWIAPTTLPNNGLDYRGNLNLTYSATGYDGSANSGTTGMAGYVSSASAGYLTKRYFDTALTGTVWMSAIVNYTNSAGDLLIWLDPPETGTANPPVFVGIRSGAQKMRTPSSDATGPAVSVGTHLLLAKFIINSSGTLDTASMWIDPNLGSGEAGLGTPGITRNTQDLFADSLSGVALSCSNHANMGIDALRVSADTDAYLQVTTGTPEPATLALLALSGLFVRRRHA